MPDSPYGAPSPSVLDILSRMAGEVNSGLSGIPGAAQDLVHGLMGSNGEGVLSGLSGLLQGAGAPVHAVAGPAVGMPVEYAGNKMGMNPQDAQQMGSNYEAIGSVAAPSILHGLKMPGEAPTRPTGGLSDPIEHPVYHGSPHTFDKFDMGKIGTGEGNQAYGHGLYFADHPEVAKSYGDNIVHADIEHHQIGKMLDWDKPLGEQPSMLKLAKEKFGPNGQPERWTGQDLYEALQQEDWGTPSAVELNDRYKATAASASQKLRDAGVPGIKYLDQGSRGKDNGTYNYVVFDDQTPKMITPERKSEIDYEQSRSKP